MTLTERQEKILQGVCREFIRKAEPISSQFLKEEQNLAFSPATIRAELAGLEKQKYLSHPFISSGRVPTDKGYRFFVDRIFKKESFGFEREKRIEEIGREFQKLRDILTISRQITKTLSSLSSNLALTYLFRENISWKEGWGEVVQEPEFQDIDYWKEFVEMTSDFEESIDNFDYSEGIRVYIGKESPLKSKDFSIIVAETSFPKKGKGVIALLGPKRMDFERNMGLVSEIVEMLKTFS